MLFVLLCLQFLIILQPILQSYLSQIVALASPAKTNSKIDTVAFQVELAAQQLRICKRNYISIFFTKIVLKIEN